MKCWRKAGSLGAATLELLVKTGHGRALGPLVAGLLLLSTNIASAQKAPELGYVYPPTVRIGASSVVSLGGYDLTTDTQYFLHHPLAKWEVDGALSEFFVPPPPYWFGEKSRLAAFPIPRETKATVTAPEQAEPGLALWQIANANGVSALAPIYLSNTPEFLEDRWREDPQTLPLLKQGDEYGVSGRLMRIAEVDSYRLQVQAPTEVHVDLMARRLGADFHAVMTVEDEHGQTIADVADTRGEDTQLSFIATPGAAYLLKLHDLDYRGNRAYVYRLGVSAGPRAETHLPTRIVPGKQTIRCLGRNLDVETIVDAGNAKHPTNGQTTHDVPTPYGSASIRLPIMPTFPEPELVFAGTQVDLVDVGQPGTARSIAWDLTAGAADAPAKCRWQLRLAAGTWQLDACSLAVGGGLDLALELLDADGKAVAKSDDDGTGPDARTTYNVKQEGSYQMVVDELSGLVGRYDSVGRISVQPASVPNDLESGFAVTAVQQVSAAAGGKLSWKFDADRSGYEGPIQLVFEGLPQGVELPTETVIPEKKNSVVLSLPVAEDAPAAAAAVRVWATGPARVAVISKVSGLAGNEETTDQFVVAVTLKPRYKLLLIDKNRQRAVHRGTTYPAPFVVEREEGFDGEVRIQMAAKQGRHRQGIDGPIISVPSGERETLYPCFMPEWLETDRTTRMVVLGVATQQDAQGNPREVTQSADARITMILEGALLSVHEHKPEGARGEHVARFGDTVELPFRISRSQKLSLPVQVELVLPAELATCCEAAPVTLAPGQQDGVLRVRTSHAAPSAPRRLGSWPLTLRATAMQSERWPVISESTVTVTFVDGR